MIPDKTKKLGQMIIGRITQQVNATGTADGEDTAKALALTAKAASEKTKDAIINPSNISAKKNQFKQSTVQSLNGGAV